MNSALLTKPVLGYQCKTWFSGINMPLAVLQCHCYITMVCRGVITMLPRGLHGLDVAAALGRSYCIHLKTLHAQRIKR